MNRDLKRPRPCLTRTALFAVEGAAMTIHRKRRHPWPLARLFNFNRLAPVVYVALKQLEVERGSPVVTPTIPDLCKLTGCRREQSVSAALTALHAAGWITRIHVCPEPDVTLLRIVIHRNQRKSLPTGRDAVTNETAPQLPLQQTTTKTRRLKNSSRWALTGCHQHFPPCRPVCEVRHERRRGPAYPEGR